MRDKLIELLNSFLGGCEIKDITPPYGVENLADYLIANGVTFAEPVKHGVWMERQIPLIPLDLDEDDVDTMYVCSECEGLNYCVSHYCPHCGAKMERIKDNDTIKAVLYNHGGESYLVRKGDKITQLVLLPIITPELELVEALEETDRANGGFGSTGR